MVGEIFRAGGPSHLLSGKATISLTSDRPTKLLSEELQCSVLAVHTIRLRCIEETQLCDAAHNLPNVN